MCLEALATACDHLNVAMAVFTITPDQLGSMPFTTRYCDRHGLLTDRVCDTVVAGPRALGGGRRHCCAEFLVWPGLINY